MLRKLEHALQAALEKPFEHLFPQKLQPAELKAQLREALEASAVSQAGRLYAANFYRLEISPSDFREIQEISAVLEQKLNSYLQQAALEARLEVGPYLTVSLGASENVPAGKIHIQTEFTAPPPAWLEIEAGLPEIGRQIPLAEKNVLGRSPQCEIVIDEAAVSRKHCEIVWEYVQYVVRDLGSANGTFVNGQHITEAALRNGDLIEIGLVHLRFHDH